MESSGCRGVWGGGVRGLWGCSGRCTGSLSREASPRSIPPLLARCPVPGIPTPPQLPPGGRAPCWQEHPPSPRPRDPWGCPSPWESFAEGPEMGGGGTWRSQPWPEPCRREVGGGGTEPGLRWRHASVPGVLSQLAGELFLHRARKLSSRRSPRGCGRGQAAARLLLPLPAPRSTRSASRTGGGRVHPAPPEPARWGSARVSPRPPGVRAALRRPGDVCGGSCPAWLRCRPWGQPPRAGWQQLPPAPRGGCFLLVLFLLSVCSSVLSEGRAAAGGWRSFSSPFQGP